MWRNVVLANYDDKVAEGGTSEATVSRDSVTGGIIAEDEMEERHITASQTWSPTVGGGRDVYFKQIRPKGVYEYSDRLLKSP